MEVSCYVAFKMQMLFTNIKSQDEYRFIMNIDNLLDSSNSCKISLQATTKPYKNVLICKLSKKKYFIIVYLWLHCLGLVWLVSLYFIKGLAKM